MTFPIMHGAAILSTTHMQGHKDWLSENPAPEQRFILKICRVPQTVVAVDFPAISCISIPGLRKLLRKNLRGGLVSTGFQNIQQIFCSEIDCKFCISNALQHSVHICFGEAQAFKQLQKLGASSQMHRLGLGLSSLKSKVNFLANCN